MRTIKEREWLDYKGKTQFKDAEGKANAQVSDVLLAVANSYQPSQTLVLNTAEMRKFNKAVDVLEQPPFEEDNKFWFEDDHFAVLKKVVMELVTRHVLARSAGEVEDLFKEETE